MCDACTVAIHNCWLLGRSSSVVLAVSHNTIIVDTVQAYIPATCPPLVPPTIRYPLSPWPRRHTTTCVWPFGAKQPTNKGPRGYAYGNDAAARAANSNYFFIKCPKNESNLPRSSFFPSLPAVEALPAAPLLLLPAPAGGPPCEAARSCCW